MRRFVATAFALFLVLGLALELLTGVFSGMLRPVTVAVIDTGVDARIPALAERLVPGGKNLLDANSDVADAGGHGTKVALAVLQACGGSGCRILPIKVTKDGRGLSARTLAAAVRYAVENGARVLNVSSGMLADASAERDDLAAAVSDATAKGAVLVAAAGTGIANPFRAENLERVFPQALPEAIVIGAAHSGDDLDPIMNHGDALDLLIVNQSSDAFGSSLAAATVSGHVAALLSRFPRATALKIRALLRQTSAPVKETWRLLDVGEVAGRTGFGSFDAEAFRRAGWRVFWPSNTVRLLKGRDGVFDLELGATAAISSVSAAFVQHESCSKPAFDITAKALPKARARVTLVPRAGASGENPGPPCGRLKINLRRLQGDDEELEVPLF